MMHHVDVRSARKRAKMSQFELALATRIDQGTISRIESGKRRPSLGQAATFFRVLGIPMDSWTDEPAAAAKEASATA